MAHAPVFPQLDALLVSSEIMEKGSSVVRPTDAWLSGMEASLLALQRTRVPWHH
jgi:hypothetical protein